MVRWVEEGIQLGIGQGCIRLPWKSELLFLSVFTNYLLVGGVSKASHGWT